MDTDDEFGRYILLSEGLLNQASREQLMEALKMLSINYGYLAHRYGDTPQDVLVEMIKNDRVSDEAKAMLKVGLGNLISLLANVMELGDDDETRH